MRITACFATVVGALVAIAEEIPVLAGTVTYHNASGQTVVRASVPPSYSGSIWFEKPSGQTCLQASATGTGTFYYRDAQGRTVGTQTTMGNTTCFYDRTGRRLGHATRAGNAVYYYDASGRLIGREDHVGSSAYFADSSGKTLLRTISPSTPEPTKAGSLSSMLGKSNAKYAPAPTPVFAPKLFLDQACQSQPR